MKKIIIKLTMLMVASLPAMQHQKIEKKQQQTQQKNKKKQNWHTNDDKIQVITQEPSSAQSESESEKDEILDLNAQMASIMQNINQKYDSVTSHNNIQNITQQPSSSQFQSQSEYEKDETLDLNAEMAGIMQNVNQKFGSVTEMVNELKYKNHERICPLCGKLSVFCACDTERIAQGTILPCGCPACLSLD